MRFDKQCEMVERAVAQGVCPSAALAIGRGGNCYVQRAWGRAALPDGAPVDLKTRYDMASLTKLLSTTMVAFHALEQGLICLSDRLDRYFDAPEDKAGITIERLMTHTSGLPASLPLWRELADPSGAAACILAAPLAAPVGARVIYSCMGYILLGFLLEKVYGKPLDALAEELVFRPLGMPRTGYRPQGANIAATEIDPQSGSAWCGIVHDENARFLGGVSGNAGVFSDLGDCARFAAMLACMGRVGERAYLSPATLRAAIVNRTPGMDENRGLGFHLTGSEANFIGDLFPPQSFGHTGFTGTSLVVDPTTGYYVVLLTNRVHPTRDNLALMRFRRLLHNAIYAAV